ncbi:hypothetical protein [Elizabethkingia meningoseptica]|uniref:hypothetical protein n=1 Tax=Elizabethkingia meningoseptica TaxID=238 RepID=UPI003891E311
MKKIVLSLMLMGATGFVFAQQTTPNTQQTKADWQAKKQQMQEKRQQHWEQMKKDLNLTADQENKIKALHEKNAADMKQKMADRKNDNDRMKMKEEMMAKKQQNDAEMQKILSPEQYTKWQGMMAQKKAERQNKMKAYKDKQKNM